MTRRWERELRSLRDIDAPVERIRSRSAIGPNRRAPDPLPPRARIAAGLVACSVFVAAGAFAWRAFDGSGNEHTGSAPGMSTYTDALGWQIDYPADWRVVPIQYDEPRVQEFGAQFSNVPLALPSSSPGAPVQPNADLAPDGVALTVTHLNGGPRRDPAGLPEPPLSPDDLTVGSAAGGSPSLDTLSFRIGDVPFDLAVKMGPEVSSDQIAVVEEMIRSIRPTAAEEVPSPSATPVPVEYATPFFPYRDGWHTRDFGDVDRGEAAAAWASTVPFEPDDRVDTAPAIPSATISALPPDGVVVTVEATPWSFDPDLGPYPPAADRPLDLSQATMRGPTAEEPPGDYSILEIQPGYLLVRVYFGVADPSPDLIALAQSELDALEIPPVCPMPATGGFGAVPSATEGAPGDTVTIDGPIQFQHEDGSYDHTGAEHMIAWWNASPDDWVALSSFSTAATPSPVGAGPLSRLGEGGGDACSFSIAFAVPEVPPGAYPIVVIAEANGSSGLEATFTFTVR